MKFDFKEVWQDFYDEAIEQGMSEDDAEFYAQENAVDHMAQLADDAHDRAKERGL